MNSKKELHPRNKHRENYDFKLLIEACPELSEHVLINSYQNESINFFDPIAVKLLNKTLLAIFYNAPHWEIPPNHLVPPIPGRADYIHYAADLLAESNQGKIPRGRRVKCLDIGVGANCIYPIIAASEYNWYVCGSEADPTSYNSAKKMITENKYFDNLIELRFQENKKDILNGIVKKGDFFDLSISNPPFHSTKKEAMKGTARKLKNLKQKNTGKSILNFGGKNNELWYEGGELNFLHSLIKESIIYAKSILWFTSLVSKESNLKVIYKYLKSAKARKIKTINMGTGNKKTRIVAWTFQNNEAFKKWSEKWS